MLAREKEEFFSISDAKFEIKIPNELKATAAYVRLVIIFSTNTMPSRFKILI